MLLGSCMQNFIKVARLESCQKSGDTRLEGKERNKASLTHFGQNSKSQVFRISTRCKADMNGMVSKITLITAELQY